MQITFEDIYQADTASGWGQVTKQSVQYYLNCNLQIGNGTDATYLSTINEDIVIVGTMVWKNNSYFTAGQYTSNVAKQGSSISVLTSSDPSGFGCYLMSSGYCTANFYASKIRTNTRINFGTSAQANATFIDCNVNSTGLSLYGVGSTIDNTIFVGLSLGLGVRATFTNDITDAVIQAASRGAYLFEGYSGTFMDCNFKDTSVSDFWLSSTTVDHYAVNCEADWTFTFSGTSTGEVYRQYTYDLTVLNGEITDFVEDANVTLSKNGVQIGTWLTNSSGQIDTQTLTYGFYNQTGGNTMYDGSYPFVLTVTHPDWADYTSRFYVTEKTKMTISMQDTTTANNAALIWSLLFGALAFALFLAWRVRR